MRSNIIFLAVLLGVLAIQAGARQAPAQAPDPSLPMPAKLSEPTRLSPPEPEKDDQPLPINLATALWLADARPLVIEAARAAVETEIGLYEQARALWLPNVYAGVDYIRHDGALQNFFDGSLIIGQRNQFLAGAGARMVFALTDAIYVPLAERQLVRARNLEVQTAKNDALLSVALTFFDVQQARGILAGTLDSVAKARELARRVQSLGRGLGHGGKSRDHPGKLVRGLPQSGRVPLAQRIPNCPHMLRQAFPEDLTNLLQDDGFTSAGGQEHTRVEQP
jgi:hypothetical protein